jgi:MFS family permease
VLQINIEKSIRLSHNAFFYPHYNLDMKTRKWYDFISINLFWSGLNFRNTALGSVFMPYMVALFVNPDVKNTALGLMRTAGLIIAMIVQPLAGMLSDRNSSRYGRRRPYIFVGVLLDLLFLTAIGLSTNYWTLSCAVLLIQISSNISHGPLQGLIPDLVPPEQHGRASAFKSIFELLPIILVPLTIAKLVEGGQLGRAILATGLFLLVTMLLTMLLVKETPLQEKPKTSLKEPISLVLGMVLGIVIGGLAGIVSGAVVGFVPGLAVFALFDKAPALLVGLSLGGLTAMIVAILVGVWSGIKLALGDETKKTPAFPWWVTNRFFFLAAATSLQGFASYFLMATFGITIEAAIGLSANLFLVAGVFTLLIALPSGWLSDKIGHRTLVLVSGLIGVLGTALLLLTYRFPLLSLIYVAGCLVGLATGLFLTTNWALGTTIVPDEKAGRYLGISNLAGAGAGMVGAGIGGPLADLINKSNPGSGYFVLFFCYAVLFLFSSLTVLRIEPSAHESA